MNNVDLNRAVRTYARIRANQLRLPVFVILDLWAGAGAPFRAAVPSIRQIYADLRMGRERPGKVLSLL